MRRVAIGLLSTLLIATGSTLVASPAQAASKPVTIKKLSTQWIGWDGSATVKPVVKKTKGATVTKKRLTVRKGATVVRKNKSAVKLKPGTYQLSTKVTYRFKGKKRTVSSKQRLVVKQGRCATQADYRSIKVNVSAGVGDAVSVVVKKVRNHGFRLSDITGDMTLGDLRELLEMEGEDVTEFNLLIDFYGEDALLDLGMYAVCKSKKKTVDVVYIDGHAVDKSVGSGL